MQRTRRSGAVQPSARRKGRFLGWVPLTGGGWESLETRLLRRRRPAAEARCPGPEVRLGGPGPLRPPEALPEAALREVLDGGGVGP